MKNRLEVLFSDESYTVDDYVQHLWELSKSFNYIEDLIEGRRKKWDKRVDTGESNGSNYEISKIDIS